MTAHWEYQRPWLYDKQRLAIFDCVDLNGDPARYSLVEASTKSGKTVSCIAWLLEQALQGKDGDNYWWVAPIYNQTKIAYRRMKRGLPKQLYTSNEQDLFLKLPSGATIWFKSADNPDSLYGDDVKAAVLDEASRMKAESWVAVRSTLTATRGPIRIIGNVKGRKNWFYRMARKAEAGAPGMAFARLSAYDAVDGGVLAAEEIADAKEQLPENVFRELYLAEPSDDEGNPFGYKAIIACLTKDWSEENSAAAGVDLAKSVDWSVVIALDRFGLATGFERWQSDWDSTERRVLELCKSLPTLVDSTGVGDPIVERMQKKHRKLEGFKFSAQSKQRLMEGLAVAIQSRQVGYPDGPIRAELENFEYVYTRTGVRYSAPEGYHDDCVMALALAVEKLRQIRPGLGHGLPGQLPRVSPWLGQ